MTIPKLEEYGLRVYKEQGYIFEGWTKASVQARDTMLEEKIRDILMDICEKYREGGGGDCGTKPHRELYGVLCVLRGDEK